MAHRLTAAATFRLDVKGTEICQAFQAAGVRSILLKGPAFGQLLYPEPGTRSYSDIDLLVDPSAVRVAEKVLVGMGFSRFDEEAPVRQTDPAVGRAVGVQGASHSVAWLRSSDNFVIDLHDSLPQVGAPEGVVWRRIAHHIDVVPVAGIQTETLDRPASALLAALHAAHHGPGWNNATADLEHALTVLDLECWKAAKNLASDLKAETAMGVGLGLTDAGRAMAQKLSLPTEPSAAQRLLWAGAPWSAGVLDSLIRLRSVRAAAALVSRILWPPPAALRRGSALARRGRLGLVAAYAVRPLRLGLGLPAALRARRGAIR